MLNERVVPLLSLQHGTHHQTHSLYFEVQFMQRELAVLKWTTHWHSLATLTSNWFQESFIIQKTNPTLTK